MAQTIVGAAAVGAAVVGAVPIPFADAAILVPTEIAEVNAIARIYGIGKGNEASHFIESLQDINWAKEVLESSLAQGAVGKIQEALKNIGNGTKPQDAAKSVFSAFAAKK